MSQGYEVLFYERENGERPFLSWLASLRDARAALAVDRRLVRLREGNPGDAKPVGEGVHELRIHYGPGLRVYFCHWGGQVVILLAGGDKGSQRADIERARTYRQDFARRNG